VLNKMADKNSTSSPQQNSDAGSLAPVLHEILKGYAGKAQGAGLKVNPLVERSIAESAEYGEETFFLEAPGNEPITFKSRLADADMQLMGQIFMEVVPKLARLNLSYNLLTDTGAELLADGLLGAKARSLSMLSVRGNSIGPQGCAAICQALKPCKELHYLDVSHNPLLREGGLHVVDLLQESTGLLQLSIADTDADIDVLVATAKLLLQGKNELKVANLENPRIQTLQEDHTVHMGRMLRVNTYLHEIYMGKHGIRDDGVRQLVSFLLENKTLRVLDLRCNDIGVEGAKHLATLLSSDCQLTQVNLSANRVGENDRVDGAQALADALLDNRMLSYLDLNRNSLSGPALSALGNAVENNSTLETLALFHNKWDQPSSYKFHQILNDRARILPLKSDIITQQVDLRIDVGLVQDFVPRKAM